MGTIELDGRGRITLPAKIREKLAVRPGDTLVISVAGDEKSIILRKSPSKEEIFESLVGCITIPANEPPTVESIKGIWKQGT